MLCPQAIGNGCVDVDFTTNHGGVIGRMCGGKFESVMVTKVSSSLFVIFVMLASWFWNVIFPHSVLFVCISLVMGVVWIFTLFPVLRVGPGHPLFLVGDICQDSCVV